MNLRRYLTWKHAFIALSFATVVIGLLIWSCHAWVGSAAAGHCYDQVNEVPAAKTALVLGCSPSIAGAPNLYYLHRIQAAVALWKAQKVRAFIVSGDNAEASYDEPTAMKNDLIKAGIPEQVIHCDYAGFRTLDSVVRAEAIFGQQEFIVVSQLFHNERALFLAQRRGLKAVGFNAQDVQRHLGLMTHLREYMARVKAVLDVTLLQTEPKFYGPKISIPE